jgi:molybdopterin converting factor small subunit
MSIEVKISSIFLRHTNNQKVAKVKGSTVGECLDHLVKQFPDLKPALFDKTGHLRRYVDIYVNDESAYPEELAREVKNGDKLDLLMLIAGG